MRLMIKKNNNEEIDYEALLDSLEEDLRVVHTVPLGQGKAVLDRWTDAIKKELAMLFKTGTLRRATYEECKQLEKGGKVIVAPAKCFFTMKPPAVPGARVKRKCRIVIPPLHMRTSTAPPAPVTAVVKKKRPLPYESHSSEALADRFERLAQLVKKCLNEVTQARIAGSAYFWQEAMGFDLAAHRLKSRTVLPQSLQEQRDALVARAKSFVDVHFEMYGKADLLQDAIDRLSFERVCFSCSLAPALLPALPALTLAMEGFYHASIPRASKAI
ncbi:hypothetical protein AK812_SmicGene10066 [Symbiodinium microadriaticum]|uniref:Uncharacterized protein n=1 Tax=Symbiodinium microadriaticum TaxID=2951 RepID=A0A1Q9EGT7_SYMMI|nr:hypothetical protein AK812_SmicGene10066 [Symbiodinium microadriaticum]